MLLDSEFLSAIRRNFKKNTNCHPCDSLEHFSMVFIVSALSHTIELVKHSPRPVDWGLACRRDELVMLAST